MASLTPVSSCIGLGTLNGKSSRRATHNLTPDAFCIASAEKYAAARYLILLQANNESADQPAHLHSLISTFFIRFLKRIIYTFVTCKVSIFELVCVVEQAGLGLTWTQIPKTGFLVRGPNFQLVGM